MMQVGGLPMPAVDNNNMPGGKREASQSKTKRRLESHPTTGNPTNINHATTPVAMAWGSSGHRTLIPPGKRSRTKGSMGPPSSPKRERPTPSALRHVHPIQASTAGTFDPVPDSVLFEAHSCRPLAMVDLSIWQDQLSTATAEDLMHRNSSFSKLILRGVRRKSDILALIARHFGRNVADLDISDSAVVDDEWLNTLGAAAECPAIASLTAARCSGVTDKGIEIFARKKGPAIRALHVPGCKSVSDDGVEFVAKHCRSLHSIDLSGCPRVRDRSVFAISALTSLQDIAVDDCTEVSDDAVRQLFTNVTQLKSLSIRGCASLTEEGLRFMHEMPVPWGTRKHRNCAMLHTFRLGRNSHVSDEFMMVLAVVCPHLRVLEVTECPLVGGDQAMGKLGGLLELEEVVLEALPRVSDNGIREFCCDLPRRALRRLNLTGCVKVTDISLKCLSKSARSLRELRLNRNVSVTDRGLGYLAKGLAANLRHLQATHLGMIGDDGVRLVARKCLLLREIDLSYCLRITPACIPALRRLRALATLGLSSCHGLFDGSRDSKASTVGESRGERTALDAADFYSLRRLELAEQPALTDAALRAVAERNSKTLTFLNVSHCPRITAGGVEKALKVLSSLKRVDLTGCDLIQASDIDGLVAHVDPWLLLSRARVDVDGFDGLGCCAGAEDARSRREAENVARHEELGARAIQRVFRRHRERERENDEAALKHALLTEAALTIQVLDTQVRGVFCVRCGQGGEDGHSFGVVVRGQGCSVGWSV